MAHFRGTLQGHRGQVSRLGSKSSGLQVSAASWQGCVDVYLTAGDDGVDHARVVLSPHHGRGISQELYSGPVGGKKKKGR